MYYLITYDEKPAIMWFDGQTRSIHFADDIQNPLHIAYLEWVAQGNTAYETLSPD
jgi:hypothetical protein